MDDAILGWEPGQARYGDRGLRSSLDLNDEIKLLKLDVDNELDTEYFLGQRYTEILVNNATLMREHAQLVSEGRRDVVVINHPSRAISTYT